MYRLGDIDDRRRVMIGAVLFGLGVLTLVVAVIIVHFASFPTEDLVDGVFVPVQIDYFGWIPRGSLMKAIGYLLAFGSSQMLVIGAALLWVLNQPMSWARAAVAAFLSWVELVLLFGIVPSEWLNFSQTDLAWSYQDPIFDIPAPLVLGNVVTVTTGALKDAISGGYHMMMLGVGALFALKLQQIGRPRPAAPPPEEKKSPYGRTLLKGED